MLERCPYDGTPIRVDMQDESSAVISCGTCGAKWEMYQGLVVRVSEPDWGVIKERMLG
jgi:hypothetical protein